MGADERLALTKDIMHEKRGQIGAAVGRGPVGGGVLRALGNEIEMG